MLNPGRFQKVLGLGVVNLYNEQMLIIGSDIWTRADLGRLGIMHSKCVSILNGIAKRLKVKSLRDFFDTTSPYSLATEPCGPLTIYVLFAIFLDRDLEPNNWYKAGQERALVTFTTLKHKELQANARTRKDERARSNRNRRSRHESDVKRILGASQRTSASA